jgi:hypothetical protein
MPKELSPFQVALNDLADTRCYCGNDKRPGCAVCERCFEHLPDDIKRGILRARALYVQAISKAKRAVSLRSEAVHRLSA